MCQNLKTTSFYRISNYFSQIINVFHIPQQIFVIIVCKSFAKYTRNQFLSYTAGSPESPQFLCSIVASCMQRSATFLEELLDDDLQVFQTERFSSGCSWVVKNGPPTGSLLYFKILPFFEWLKCSYKRNCNSIPSSEFCRKGYFTIIYCRLTAMKEINTSGRESFSFMVIQMVVKHIQEWL